MSFTRAKLQVGSPDEALKKMQALEAKLAPRELTKDQLDAFLAVAKPFSGQQYVLSVAGGAEPFALACSIKKVLNQAGWVRKDWINSQHVDICGDGEAVSVNLLSHVGLWIRPDATEAVQKVQSALFEALKADTIDVFKRTEPNVNIEPTTIHVMVGAKL